MRAWIMSMSSKRDVTDVRFVGFDWFRPAVRFLQLSRHRRPISVHNWYRHSFLINILYEQICS